MYVFVKEDHKLTTASIFILLNSFDYRKILHVPLLSKVILILVLDVCQQTQTFVVDFNTYIDWKI